MADWIDNCRIAVQSRTTLYRVLDILFGDVFLSRSGRDSHRFLKFAVVLSLIVLIQTNFACATMANGGHLLQVLMQRYHLSSNQTPIETMVDTYIHYVITPPPFVNDYDPLAAISWALVQSYAPLTGPLFLLLFLITPHFLALPVYWLWVVLSALYVVLPARAWIWVRGEAARAGLTLRRNRTPRQ
jgi:hypothetical protein